jgi:hypothetical protein
VFSPQAGTFLSMNKCLTHLLKNARAGRNFFRVISCNDDDDDDDDDDGKRNSEMLCFAILFCQVLRFSLTKHMAIIMICAGICDDKNGGIHHVY